MRRALLPLLLTAVVTGCGGAPAATTSDGEAAVRDRMRTAPLTVGATQLRLGDATAADDRRGGRQLPAGPREVVPEDLYSGARRDGVGAGASCPDRDLLPDGTNIAAVRTATLCLLNGERTDAGLVPLRANDRLSTAALGHSLDMVAEQFFSHRSEDGRDLVARIRVTGYIDPRQRWTLGENIGWGSGTLSTPASMVAAWMNSPGHRANVLHEQFREIGIGITPGSPRDPELAGAATYTTDFGTIGDPDAQPVAVAATAPGPKATPPKARTSARVNSARRRSAERRNRSAQRRRTAVRHRQLSARKVPVRARIALGPEASPPGH